MNAQYCLWCGSIGLPMYWCGAREEGVLTSVLRTADWCWVGSPLTMVRPPPGRGKLSLSLSRPTATFPVRQSRHRSRGPLTLPPCSSLHYLQFVVINMRGALRLSEKWRHSGSPPPRCIPSALLTRGRTGQSRPINVILQHCIIVTLQNR